MKFKLIFIFEAAFLTIVFFLINVRSFIFWTLYPETDNLFGEAWWEVFIWSMALLLMLYLLEKRNLIKNYLLTWSKEPILISFIFFSLVSVLWSDMWTVTLHRSLVLVFASLVAVFLGVRYSMNDFLRSFYWFGVIIVIASFLLVVINPSIGTDLNPGYNGTWRGVFWHKNQLGNILPILNLIFLFRFFSLKFDEAAVEKILAVVLYFLSLIEIFFTNSASGYILVLLLHFAFGIAFLWLKIKHFLRPVHYAVILAVFLAGGIGVLLNLGFILGLLNREVTFTGRIPMWAILFRDVFPQNPWFGQGFGTTWANLDFRLQMRDLAGWPYPIMIGDNGFIDILLNLGIVGLLIFFLYYIKAWIDSVRYFLREASLEGFFPFIFMIYTFFANLTFSLFMETEVFVWTIIVVITIMSTQKRNKVQIA